MYTEVFMEEKMHQGIALKYSKKWMNRWSKSGKMFIMGA